LKEKRNRVIIISSVSGGGKTTLVNLLTQKHPELKSAITATSRPPRPGEVHEEHYHFYSLEDFARMIEQNELLEHAFVHGNYYGVPVRQVYDRLEKGESVVLNIDVQGMRAVKQRLGEKVLSIFILPPDRETWEKRLRSRGTDDEEVIRRRLEEGQREMKAAAEYDYRVVNDVLESAVGELVAILSSENVI